MIIDPDDGVAWRDAIFQCADAMRRGTDGQGDELAALLRSGAPIGPNERELLALLVSDRLLGNRNGRPMGDMHPLHLQMAVARGYIHRKLNAPRGHASRIKHQIGQQLGLKDQTLAVSGKTVERWATEYKRTVAALDNQMRAAALGRIARRLERLDQQGRHRRAALIRQHQDSLVAKHVQLLTRLGRDGNTLLQQLIARNSK